ncbi:MAG: hypothetical protein HUK08_01970 [Bacteroidaceae bacterium]|nr:hypothetical protein [Bacteroidaceae bacterium]
MSAKRKYRCPKCGSEADLYDGIGFFKQRIESVVCGNCKAVRNLTVGGIISQIAPSFDSLVGRLCPECGSEEIRLWDGRTCPKCGETMIDGGDEEYWT